MKYDGSSIVVSIKEPIAWNNLAGETAPSLDGATYLWTLSQDSIIPSILDA